MAIDDVDVSVWLDPTEGSYKNHLMYCSSMYLDADTKNVTDEKSSSSKK